MLQVCQIITILNCLCIAGIECCKFNCCCYDYNIFYRFCDKEETYPIKSKWRSCTLEVAMLLKDNYGMHILVDKNQQVINP